MSKNTRVFHDYLMDDMILVKYFAALPKADDAVQYLTYS